MRTGDAEAEFWLESLRKGRGYAVVVRSQRVGLMGSKRWQRPRYYVRVELWLDEEPNSIDSRVAVAETFTEAMRLGRRLADKMEGQP